MLNELDKLHAAYIHSFDAQAVCVEDDCFMKQQFEVCARDWLRECADGYGWDMDDFEETLAEMTLEQVVRYISRNVCGGVDAFIEAMAI